MQKPKLGEDKPAGKSMYGDDMNEDELEDAIFRKKHSYHYQDLIDYYEKSRFTLPFIVYRKMNWWPFLDACATYGHGVSNGIIVYIAINWSVSFFMSFNIICICLFYFKVTQKLNKEATKTLHSSGL